MISNDRPIIPEARLFQLKYRVNFLLKAFAMFNFRRKRRQDGTAPSTNEAYNTLNYALEKYLPVLEKYRSLYLL